MFLSSPLWFVTLSCKALVSLVEQSLQLRMLDMRNNAISEKGVHR